ncbi:MAG: hypothetical protein U5L11_08120 [Arhodomonas sp.]|nr:hypothetical protein [Arhodomonas sp.]
MIESPLLPRIAGYIGGQWSEGSARPITVTNPANGEVLAEFPGMGENETLEAVRAAEARSSSARAWRSAASGC